MTLPEPYYSDESVVLYHGDAIEVCANLPSVDTCITDPPFFMPAQQYAGRSEAWDRSWGDTSILATWWDGVLEAVTPKVKGHFITFCDDESYAVFFPGLYSRYPNLASLVWDKGVPGMGTAWRHSHELLIAARPRNAFWTGGADTDVLRHPPVHNSDRLHPVDKPVGLLSDLIEPTTPKNGSVLDPFAGGGATLVAAKRSGREAIGVEIEERYCETAAERLSQGVLELRGAV